RGRPCVGDAGGGSKAKPLADAIGLGVLALGVAWALPAAMLLVHVHGFVQGTAAVLACALAAALMAGLLRRRLQGFTGDGLGATQQVCELAVYLSLAFRACSS